MTSRHSSASHTERRMSGHVKKVHLQQFMESAAALLSLLLLLMAVDPRTAAATTTAAAASSNPDCGIHRQQMMKVARLAHKESADLFKTFKTSQGEMSEFSCKVPQKDVPSSVISGLEPSERVDSIYSLLQDFLPHFKRVYDQQVDIQSPSSQLLTQLKAVPARGRHLADAVREFYRCLFPNLPVPEPAEGPTALPPAQNIFQQKMYGCVVLRSYKDFLSNVMRETRTLKNKLSRKGRPEMNTFIF